MKRTLLFLLLLPQMVFGRKDDPRIRIEVPYPSVKSVKTITYFTLPKEGNKLDTCIVELHQYNQDGLLTRHDYSMIMQKNPRYDYWETYVYSAEDAWIKQVYKRGVRTDSASVNGSWANEYYFKEGKIHTFYEFRVDTMAEKEIRGADTVLRHRSFYDMTPRDEFWDYIHAGAFARKAVQRDKDGAETVTYYNAKDEAMASYREHRVSGGKVSQIDYYNYKVKRFELKHLPYNDKLYMTFFLEKSKKGKPSYQILYTYNDKKQLIEEKWVDPNPKKNQVVIKYEYEYYQ